MSHKSPNESIVQNNMSKKSGLIIGQGCLKNDTVFVWHSLYFAADFYVFAWKNLRNGDVGNTCIWVQLSSHSLAVITSPKSHNLLYKSNKKKTKN